MKKVLLSALMALVGIGSQAQQTIDVYKTVKLPPMDGITLVTVNKAKLNIYEKPNGKRRAEPWGAPGEYIVEYGPSLFGVKMHPTGWAYIFSGSESGFASPKDFHKANLTPFKDWMFNTAEASFNDGHFNNTWRIGINKATGLALKIWGIEKSRQNLGIGRLKDNALVVILNTVLIEPKYQESQNTINIIQKKDESDNNYYEIIYGKNNSIKTNRGIRINLETIPEAILTKLFLPVNEGFGEYREIVKEWKDIEYSQWDGIDYYNDAVNAELMSAPFVNEQTAINAFKATAPTNQTGSSSAAPSTKQRSHMEFLGLEMGGDPAQFIKALRQKGFTDGSGFSQDKTQIFLSGMVYGMKSEICVYTEGNRVNSVSVNNMVTTKTAAVNRCNRFKKEMTAIYGTGAKWTTPYESAAELKLPYGKVKYEYGMFDSGDYELSMFIIDEGKSTPAPQQTQTGDTDMLTTIDNQIAAAKKKVQENPSAESYYELANIQYLKYTKINDDSEKKTILKEIDKIYRIIIDKYPNASAVAVVGHATIVNVFNPDTKKGVAKPLYEKFLQMIEPKVKNKTYNGEEKSGYLAACLYLYRYYAEKSDFKQVKYYLMKYDAMEPGNENVKKMLDLLK